MGLASFIGTPIGKVTGGEYNGYKIMFGTDKKFGIGISTSIYNQLIFTHPFKKDVRVFIKDFKSYKVISNAGLRATISLELENSKTIIEVVGKNISTLIGLLEQYIS
jgi:hypothetical protein